MATRDLTPDPAALNWVIGSALVVLAPHFTRIPLWLTAAFAGLLAWRYASSHHRWYLPGRLVRLVLALVLSAAVFKEYGTLLGRDAGMAMLVGLTGMKFMEARSLRDYLLTVFLLYLLIAGYFLYSQSLLHGAYMVLAVVLCTTALVRLNQPGGGDPRFNLRLAAALLLKAVPLMIFMYLLFPRLQGGLWGLPSDAYSGLTGLSETMNPGSISRLSQSTKTAFRVEFHGERPPGRALYWRALLLWETDGRRWQPGAPLAPAAGPVIKTGAPVSYTITLEPTNKNWLPALDLPATVPKEARRQAGFLLQSRARVTKRIRYTLASQAQHQAGPLASPALEQGLLLPRVSSRVQALADRWRASASGDRAVAQAAMDYFRQQPFFYTLTPPLLGSDPVDEFLFSTRRGFCEHYAAAFVTLMRAAGIPSRVVAGYQGGEYNAAGDYLIVRQSDAHAWAEIWLAGEGWVRVDPTAAVAPERIELGIDAVRRLQDRGMELGQLSSEAVRLAIKLGLFETLWKSTRLYWDAANLAWYRWASDYDWERQERLLNALGFYAPSWLGMLAGLGGVLVVVTFGIAWFMRRRRRPRDPVLAAYMKFCRKLEKAGLKRRPAEGPKDFAQRSSQQLPETQNQIQTITTLYTQLRYGDGPKELLDEMKKQMRDLKLQRVGVA